MTRKVFARPVTRSRLHEEIVTVIQQQIMSGQIAPGEKLPTEREMAENFNVNRATVREALRKLENIDLLGNPSARALCQRLSQQRQFDLIKAAVKWTGDRDYLQYLEARRYLVRNAYLRAKAHLIGRRRSEAAPF
jgi:GntR family transcriptional repressor for pyruvate dehydrogenase complex